MHCLPAYRPRFLCAACQLDYLHQEVQAGRRFQEEDCCPEVFCLVPADTSSWSTLERLERWKIFTKHMRLFFVCTTFFDEIRASMSPQPEEARRNNIWDECSEFIDITQPSVRCRLLYSLRSDCAAAHTVRGLPKTAKFHAF